VRQFDWILAFGLLIAVFAAPRAVAAPAPSPCSAPEYRQFDF
jgi:hypothetical protein